MMIGFRNLKTGLSVLACLLFYYFLNRDGCLLASVSAIICMQDNVEKSLANGVNRLSGTAIGALQGMVFLYIDNFIDNDYLAMVLITVGVILLIWYCNLLKRRESIVIGCMVFLTIMLGQSQSPFFYSVNRLLDTFIGVLVAVVVNRFVLNPQQKRQQGAGGPEDEEAPGHGPDEPAAGAGATEK